jgi:hypothetical protein
VSDYRVRVRAIYRSRWRMVLTWLRGRRDMFWHDARDWPNPEELR